MQISKDYFEAHAFELFRQVESTGEALVVTDKGKPTIEVRPYKIPDHHLLQMLRGSVKRYDRPFDSVI